MNVSVIKCEITTTIKLHFKAIFFLLNMINLLIKNWNDKFFCENIKIKFV